jgi:acylphosphatase
MKEIDCIITGKVQMVMFRDFVYRKARGLGINGYVENLHDGSLHVVAQGTKESLNKLIEHLHKGPFLAKVKDVVVTWGESHESIVDFSIKY